MKLSQILFKQHKGRMIRYNWQVQCERRVLPTAAVKTLSALNIELEDPVKVADPGIRKIEIDPEFHEREAARKAIEEAKALQDYHEKPAFLYSDKYVLQAGMSQAQALTKTLLISNELPETFAELKSLHPKINHKIVERIIETSCIYDAHQEKLPIVKDPARPAWVFPRDYGITSTRKMDNLAKKLVQYCEILCGPSVAQHRNIVHHGYVSTTVDHGPDALNLEATIGCMLTSPLAEKAFKEPSSHKASELPDLHPLHHMLGLSESNTYKEEPIYPIHQTSLWAKPHTLFLHYDASEVKNKTELPVTEDQTFSHALLKSFTTAACYARLTFGKDVKDLPQTVSVQCIHTDGKGYNFGVYQLNTLDLEKKDGLMNYLWFTPTTDLYSKAQYEEGRPIMTGYNPAVFENLLAFYKNQPGFV